MNIEYVPQKSEKSEKISFTGILFGCAASILIFLLLSWFLNSDLYYRWKLQEDGEYPTWVGIFVTSIIVYSVTCGLIYLVDSEILKKFHKYCNSKFLKTYISSTILLGFYTKWVYTSFFFHKNKDDSAQFLNFILDPVLVIKDTITTSSFLDLFLGFILIISLVGTKYLSITEFKENDVHCNYCNKWPDIIEFRLYTNNFNLISQKFNSDVNCLLSLQVIDVSSIESKTHEERDREFRATGAFDPPIDLITSSKHIKVNIHHCSTCKKFNTISIYSVKYSDSQYCYKTEDYIKVSPTYILTKEQFEAFQLKQHETKTDICKILEKSMNS